MATKEQKKEQLRLQIINAAKTYSNELAGKVFLYVYGHEYFEMMFRTDSFLHLTGVDSALSAKQFYRKSYDGTLTEKQFYFSEKHPFAGAKKKLPCLQRLPELTKDYVCILKGQRTLTIVYKLSVTNFDFTLGLAEHLDGSGNKIDDIYLPRSLRVKDHAAENSPSGEIVDFIFSRNASIDTYNQILVCDPQKEIPSEIKHLINPTLL